MDTGDVREIDEDTMRYYVVADVHGFYSELQAALTEKGFYEDKEPHKLVVCGDLLDRGCEALKLQKFILELLKKDEVILIKGNHEDLFLDLINNAEKWMTKANIYSTHHWRNGTIDAALQLTGKDLQTSVLYPEDFKLKAKNTPFYKTIIPAMKDYYETNNYIFVHGWIPCAVMGRGIGTKDTFIYEENWREQGEDRWNKARWLNGMAAASCGVREPNKTIVCGHWHCSYGHAELEGKGKEFDADSDFSPYYADGIIAIDACTAFSRKVNCIVIEDDIRFLSND